MNLDTVDFFPVVNPIPSIITDDYLRQAAEDILYILKKPQKTIPSLTYGNEISNTYIHLVQIFKIATRPPPKIQHAPVPVPRVVTPETVHTQDKPSPSPTPCKKLSSHIPTITLPSKIAQQLKVKLALKPPVTDR